MVTLERENRAFQGVFFYTGCIGVSFIESTTNAEWGNFYKNQWSLAVIQ